jgi:uncharacterized membrane protein
MTLRLDVLLFIAALGGVSLFCRFGGYVLMRYVRFTPPIEAGLKAAPLAVMCAIVAPAAFRGGLLEWLALAAILIASRFFRNDLVTAMIGLAIVAGGRAFGTV